MNYNSTQIYQDRIIENKLGKNHNFNNTSWNNQPCALIINEKLKYYIDENVILSIPYIEAKYRWSNVKNKNINKDKNINHKYNKNMNINIDDNNKELINVYKIELDFIDLNTIDKFIYLIFFSRMSLIEDLDEFISFIMFLDFLNIDYSWNNNDRYYKSIYIFNKTIHISVRLKYKYRNKLHNLHYLNIMRADIKEYINKLVIKDKNENKIDVINKKSLMLTILDFTLIFIFIDFIHCPLNKVEITIYFLALNSLVAILSRSSLIIRYINSWRNNNIFLFTEIYMNNMKDSFKWPFLYYLNRITIFIFIFINILCCFTIKYYVSFIAVSFPFLFMIYL